MNILLNPFENFKRFPEIKIGVTTRQLGAVKKDKMLQKEAFKKLAKEFGDTEKQFIFMNQVHGAEVQIVSDSVHPSDGVDGMITTDKNLVLCTVTADCLPIVVYEPIKKIIGVLHAGYKGLLNGIIEEELRAIQKLGGNTSELIVGIGPGIGVCCYDVPASRVQQFQERFPAYKNMYEHRNGMYFLDLKSIASQKFQELGVQLRNIEILPYCTSCNNDLFYSYRKEDKSTYGEFATVIERLG